LGEDVFRICSPDSSNNRGAPCTTDTDCGAFGTCVAITAGVDLLHVSGAEVVPSSIHEVQLFDQAQENCGDRLEGMFSAPLTIPTARWGDVVAPFQAPSPVPLSEPSALDITAEVSKVGYPPGWPIKVVAQLQGNVPDPNNDIRELDKSLCADAVNGFQYPFSGPVICPCTANIRMDSDNDGDIDYQDELVENVSPGAIIYVNDDDDNFDGVRDLNELPVTDENDLAEIQLPQDCYPVNPATAWWSISWTPNNPSIAVWLAPDKSLPAPPAPRPFCVPSGGERLRRNKGDSVILILLSKTMRFLFRTGVAIGPLGRVRAIKPQFCGPQSR
jgi:hypothetical protein